MARLATPVSMGSEVELELLTELILTVRAGLDILFLRRGKGGAYQSICMYLVRRAVERARAETRQQDCYNVCMLTGVLNVARHPSELQNDGVYKNCFLNIPNATALDLRI